MACVFVAGVSTARRTDLATIALAALIIGRATARRTGLVTVASAALIIGRATGEENGARHHGVAVGTRVTAALTVSFPHSAFRYGVRSSA